MDIHYKFSKVALVDASGPVVRRVRLDHRDRQALRREFSRWPAGITVVLEASFGWSWLSDLMDQAGLNARLSNGFKVEKMRQARNLVKTNDMESITHFRTCSAPAAGRS